ncbi:MAG: Mur ligase family protein, partial [Gaiellaceae bacterium]
MDLELLIDALTPVEVVGRAPVDIADVVYDAREAGPGSLYFCVPGSRADGHDFAPDAVASGAAALVVERPLKLPVPQLVVEDARRAMPIAADEFFGRPTEQLEVAGVTGTNGKTTTAFLLYAILAAAGRRPGLLGTIESRVGGERRPAIRTTPEAIDLQATLRRMLDAGDEAVSMEVSSHAIELGRVSGIRYAVKLFTNLTQDHLDFHGTMEAYYAAKRRLFDEPGIAVVNSDDEHGRRIASEVEATTFGIDSHADYRAREIDFDFAGSHFLLDTPGGTIEVESPLPGLFNVLNV